MRRLLAAALLLAVPALANAQGNAAPKAPPTMPGRWKMHLDNANLPSDYTFVAMGPGYHATTGRAAGIMFDPQMTAAGAYHLEGTFTQTKAPAHPEAYGLIFGGSALDTPQAEYFYFVVRGDGKYLVKHHASNGETHTVVDWTASPALHAADASGKATNALRVDVGADSVRLSANGTRVFAASRAGGLKTDGIVGVRVNHMLDVHIDGPKLTK